MLIISVPEDPSEELSFVLAYVLGDRLALDWRLEESATKDYRIALDGSHGQIELPDIFFRRLKDSWLEPCTLPQAGTNDLVLASWMGLDSREEFRLPVVYGREGGQVSEEEGVVSIPVDVFGSIFFMLSRYEEAVKPQRDAHGRFPYAQSYACKAGVINRPLVDEYIECLWNAMRHCWPSLERNHGEFSIQVSCDVDVPYSPQVNSLSATLKQMTGDVIKRRSIVQAARTGLNFLCSKFGIYAFDLCYTFDWIMEVNENAGNVVTFFFIAENTTDGMNGCYRITEKRIRALLWEIHRRGHVIGLHGGYETYKNSDQYRTELGCLEEVLKEEGIYQASIPNRQHYLKWETCNTPQVLERAGVSHDSSLAYAEHAGFRAGTCYEFPMYDLIHRAPLALVQRPLVVMEGSVISENYMELGETNEALGAMVELKQVCRRYKGNFTLLWHNDAFVSNWSRETYLALIGGD
jgi:Family of unknown function (DUF7033)